MYRIQCILKQMTIIDIMQSTETLHSYVKKAFGAGWHQKCKHQYCNEYYCLFLCCKSM